MPIIEVNHVTKEYQLGQLQSMKTTAFNQWRRLTGQPIEERARARRWMTSISPSSKARCCLVLLAPQVSWRAGCSICWLTR
ncbi:MAG: hypothetical protein IPN81_01480 [Nitrosomonadales bacterium]|nr:hypothetical protein [Nitrosomonadales bacterium]